VLVWGVRIYFVFCFVSRFDITNVLTCSINEQVFILFSILYRGLRVNCGCFEQFSDQSVNIFTFFRTSSFFVLCGFVFIYKIRYKEE